MELRRSCVLPNTSALPGPDSGTTGRVLQEHSGNRGPSYDEDVIYLKRTPSSGNCYLEGSNNRYFDSSGVQPQYNKSKEQIEHEFQQVWSLLQTCEVYRKYREKKPKSAKAVKKWKENVWPENIERAFFRGTIPFLTLYPPGQRAYVHT
jgi:hypothetical protein